MLAPVGVKNTLTQMRVQSGEFAVLRALALEEHAPVFQGRIKGVHFEPMLFEHAQQTHKLGVRDCQ